MNNVPSPAAIQAIPASPELDALVARALGCDAKELMCPKCNHPVHRHSSQGCCQFVNGGFDICECDETRSTAFELGQRAAAIAHLREISRAHRDNLLLAPGFAKVEMQHIQTAVAAYRAIGVLPPARGK